MAVSESKDADSMPADLCQLHQELKYLSKRIKGGNESDLESHESEMTVRGK